MEQKTKRKWGDKRDARLIKGKELDTNHFVMPLLWPRRTDNEAFLSETIDITEVTEFLKEKNKDGKKFSLFMFYLAVLGKTILNRPKMNRFYRHGRLYERYKVSLGFIVKKEMTDDGDEALARIFVEPDDTFDTFCEKVRREIDERRSEVMDKSSNSLRVLMKFPHFIGKIVMNFLRVINHFGVVPDGVTASDMSFTSAIISNLGSIRLHAGYHHLSNWGTNSFFTVLGEKKVRPFYDKFGNMTLKDSIDIGLTIDERIADGYYFSKSIQYIKNYFKHPELLEAPFLDK